MNANIIPEIVTGFIPFLFALCAHEYAHGWVANRLGDPTAKLMGRLTLNPIAHADPLGTVILPIMGMATGIPMIGWAKPVPVNARNLRNQKTGMFWVALAGPGSNIIMAILGSAALVLGAKYLGPSGFLFDASRYFVQINLALAFFNLIPIPPLDGAKIFEIFLPESVNRKLLEMQMVANLVLVALFFTGVLGKVLGFVIGPIYMGLIEIAAKIFGVQ